MAETKKAVTKTEEELVTITLPLTRSLKDDVYVSVNDRSWLIQRGEAVQVPKCVAEVLRHQEEMLLKAIKYEEGLASQE